MTKGKRSADVPELHARGLNQAPTLGASDYRALVESVPEQLWSADAEGRFQYINKPVPRELGLTPGETIVDGWRQIVHPDDLPGVIAGWERSLRTGEPYRAELRVRTGDSGYRWHVARAVAVRDANGAISGWAGTSNDVQELKAAQSAAETAEQTLLDILESISDAFFATDRDWRFTYVNERAAQMLGRHRRELLGRLAWEEFKPTRGTAFERMLHRAMKTGEPVAFEEWYEPTRSWFEVRAYPRRMGLAVYFTDATERHEATIERERLLTLAESSQREAQEHRARAEAANQTKTDFLATMSHEIRTPINAILGYADLMDLGIAGPLNERQREFLERLTSSGRHLLGLVDEILDLTRVESGRMTIVEERADLGLLVESAIALVGPQAAQRGLSIEYDCSLAEGELVMGDEGRIRQILVNLLTNAVKFTDSAVEMQASTDNAGGTGGSDAGNDSGDARPGPDDQPGAGRIHVVCGSGGSPGGRAASSNAKRGGTAGWHYVRVSDQGIGIPKEQLESIFEPFVQLEKSHVRTRSGVGLGLAISRRLARLMGGDLTATSTVGAGSSFTLWLPAFAEREAEPLRVERHLRLDAEERTTVHAVGRWLAHEAERVTVGFAKQLRTDPAIPPARTLNETDLMNHISTYLLDLAKSLPVLAQSEEPSAALLDGSEIQEVIAERHGAQRYRVGFTEAMLEREVVLFSEYVVRALREQAPGETREHLERAVELLELQMEQGGRISRRGFRNAREVAHARRGV